jgi:ribosomal protein L12E/L44/L45/RPP1/RPP2
VARLRLGGCGDRGSVQEGADQPLTRLPVTPHPAGAEADSAKVEKLLSEMAGKSAADVIAAGSKKLASVPSGGAAPAGGAAAAPAAGGAPAKEEKKKEEPKVRREPGGG